MIQLQWNVAADFRFEAGRDTGDLIGTGVDEGENVVSRFVGGCRADVAGFDAFGSDDCAGDDGAGGIGDEAENLG